MGANEQRVWAWKDELPRLRVAWHGRFVAGRKSFLSPALLAAHYPDNGTLTDHEDFELSPAAHQIAELLAGGPLTSAELRVAVGDRRRYERAVGELQRHLLVTGAGVLDCCSTRSRPPRPSRCSASTSTMRAASPMRSQVSWPFDDDEEPPPLVCVVDTSVLVDLKKLVKIHQHWDVFEHMRLMTEQGRITFPRQVYREISRGNYPDMPGGWVGKAQTLVKSQDPRDETLAKIGGHAIRGLVESNAEPDYEPADPLSWRWPTSSSAPTTSSTSCWSRTTLSTVSP